MKKTIAATVIGAALLLPVTSPAASAAPTAGAVTVQAQVAPMAKQPIIHRKDKWKCGFPWIYRDYYYRYCKK